MRRREFIGLLGGGAAAPSVWPSGVRAQPRERMRRIGVLVSQLAADDPEWQARSLPFAQRLQELGWSEGRNVRIDIRWGVGDVSRLRSYAAELVALAPDVILAPGNLAVEALQQVTRTVPIVFANSGDPLGMGYVASLARPGGNTTGFMNIEFGESVKWLELLKQIAPGVKRVVVVRSSGVGLGLLGAIQGVAPALGVEVTPLLSRDADEINRGITAFVRGPNDGLIATDGGATQVQRGPIIALAAQHRLPAVYPIRRFVTEGGLISYGPDRAEPYRLAAGYVDRILRGEKPSDLPVQAPTRYETVLNMKTAKALGIDVPTTVLVRADEVIE
jgi:putative ABC transport system substrate-binding protein